MNERTNELNSTCLWYISQITGSAMWMNCRNVHLFISCMVFSSLLLSSLTRFLNSEQFSVSSGKCESNSVYKYLILFLLILFILNVLIWWWTTLMWMYSYFFRIKEAKFNMLSLIKPTNIISIVLCQFCHSYSIRMKNINILFKRERERKC